MGGGQQPGTFLCTPDKILVVLSWTGLSLYPVSPYYQHYYYALVKSPACRGTNISASSPSGQSAPCSPQSRTQRALTRYQTLWKEGLSCGS